MDILAQTQGFTLQHLRFLVIDEADRLLDQSFQDWLNNVLRATHSGTQGDCHNSMTWNLALTQNVGHRKGLRVCGRSCQREASEDRCANNSSLNKRAIGPFTVNCLPFHHSGGA